jgi:hypothetical protein
LVTGQKRRIEDVAAASKGDLQRAIRLPAELARGLSLSMKKRTIGPTLRIAEGSHRPKGE